MSLTTKSELEGGKKPPFCLKLPFDPNTQKKKGSTAKRIILRYIPSDTDEDNYHSLQNSFHKQRQETDNDDKTASSLLNANKIQAKQKKKVRFSDDISNTRTTNRKKLNRMDRSERLFCTPCHGNRSSSFFIPLTDIIINLKNCIFVLINCFLFSLLIKTWVKVFLSSS